MTLVHRSFHSTSIVKLAFTLLPITAGLVISTMSVAQADQARVCENYGVVRDRSDNEAPILPRSSVGHCARSYQTLYHTYRVHPAAGHDHTSDSIAPNSDHLQVDSQPNSQPALQPDSQSVNPGSSASTETNR